MAVVTAEQAHVVVVAVVQGWWLLPVVTDQPHTHITLHHLVQLPEGHLRLQLRTTLDVLWLLTEDVAGSAEDC